MLISLDCPRCGLRAHSVPGESTCECGTYWGPFPKVDLCREEWDTIFTLLLTRSGGYCEARTPACLAPGGFLATLTRDRVSLHHRQPRGMGGTSDIGVHALSRLVLICGTGTTGCHGHLEYHRAWAYKGGWLVKHSVPGRLTPDTDCRVVPLTLRSGRRVRIDDISLEYQLPFDGILYAA